MFFCTKRMRLEKELDFKKMEVDKYKAECLHYKELLADVTRATNVGLCRGTWCAICEHSYRYPEDSDLRGLCVCRFSPCKEFSCSLPEA